MCDTMKLLAREGIWSLGVVAVVGLIATATAWSQSKPPCAGLPDHAALRSVLQTVMKLGPDKTTGLGNPQWGALVNRDGLVCAVAFSSPTRSDPWPGSRLIAAEKAHTANALSAPGYALSTANLFAATQPGQSLYGLITTAPPNAAAAYAGDPSRFGQANDPLVGKPIGGIVVFGGGLPLYDSRGQLVGGLGVSGDTSCADHVVAWKVRHALHLDRVPAGPAPDSTDNLILDILNGTSASGFGHPTCKGGKSSDDTIKKLPATDPVARTP
jgi:uncharacterized protein GlcG (DUF336 family)